MLDKQFDGPICENEFEALNEASVAFVKFVNARELQKRNEMYAAAPGLYTPQNFVNPSFTPVAVANHKLTLPIDRQQQVLVPGQVSQQFFTPDSFNPTSQYHSEQSASSSSPAAAGFYMNQRQHQQLSPALFAIQNSLTCNSDTYMQSAFAPQENVR